ncbi:MAG: hypothetical protein NWF06_04140 [Candidatus Bathyarchaeota archaeon]|nr:hypothetical protein [Candidatus Bathyarchaeum sp.]
MENKRKKKICFTLVRTLDGKYVLDTEKCRWAQIKKFDLGIEDVEFEIKDSYVVYASKFNSEYAEKDLFSLSPAEEKIADDLAKMLIVIKKRHPNLFNSGNND